MLIDFEQFDVRHPRKDIAALTLKPGERRKLLGGHCECFEKQALILSSLVINNQNNHSKSHIITAKATLWNFDPYEFSDETHINQSCISCRMNNHKQTLPFSMIVIAIVHHQQIKINQMNYFKISHKQTLPFSMIVIAIVQQLYTIRVWLSKTYTFVYQVFSGILCMFSFVKEEMRISSTYTTAKAGSEFVAEYNSANFSISIQQYSDWLENIVIATNELLSNFTIIYASQLFKCEW